MDRLNKRYETLCAQNGIPLKIDTVTSAEAPRHEVSEADGVVTLSLNPSRIRDYKNYLAYAVRTVLLPRLVLKTERLILRRFRMEDAAAYFPFMSDERGAYLDCCKPFKTMDEEYEKLMEQFAQREGQYVVILRPSGEVIGTVNVFADDSRGVECMEIGYSIAPAHQRKGYAYEAISALLHLLQEELGLEMVVAGVLTGNEGSIQLLKKLGFQMEGLRHKAAWHEGLNRPVDLVYYYRDRQEVDFDFGNK